MAFPPIRIVGLSPREAGEARCVNRAAGRRLVLLFAPRSGEPGSPGSPEPSLCPRNLSFIAISLPHSGLWETAASSLLDYVRAEEVSLHPTGTYRGGNPLRMASKAGRPLAQPRHFQERLEEPGVECRLSNGRSEGDPQRARVE